MREIDVQNVLPRYQERIARQKHIRRQRKRFMGSSLLGGMSVGGFFLAICLMLTRSYAVLLVGLIMQDATFAVLLPLLWLWARRVYPDEW